VAVRRPPVDAQREMLRHADKIALDWQAAFAFAPDRPGLARLGARTLLIRGDRSPRPMVHLVDALHALMPGSARVIVSGASHLLPLTRPSDVTQAILAHLHADAERRMR
jgi:pimeloyl-ACP methyl ester carboxylesterase